MHIFSMIIVDLIIFNYPISVLYVHLVLPFAINENNSFDYNVQ